MSIICQTIPPPILHLLHTFIHLFIHLFIYSINISIILLPFNSFIHTNKPQTSVFQSSLHFLINSSKHLSIQVYISLSIPSSIDHSIRLPPGCTWSVRRTKSSSTLCLVLAQRSTWPPAPWSIPNPTAHPSA